MDSGESPNKETTDPPLTSAEVNLFGAMIVALGRVYDVGLEILMQMDMDAAKNLRAMHEEGHLYFPPPTFILDDDD